MGKGDSARGWAVLPVFVLSDSVVGVGLNACFSAEQPVWRAAVLASFEGDLADREQSAKVVPANE